jgi:hypothetical protein
MVPVYKAFNFSDSFSKFLSSLSNVSPHFLLVLITMTSLSKLLPSFHFIDNEVDRPEEADVTSLLLSNICEPCPFGHAERSLSHI